MKFSIKDFFSKCDKSADKWVTEDDVCRVGPEYFWIFNQQKKDSKIPFSDITTFHSFQGQNSFPFSQVQSSQIKQVKRLGGYSLQKRMFVYYSIIGEETSRSTPYNFSK